jgi:hypothetical protein
VHRECPRSQIEDLHVTDSTLGVACEPGAYIVSVDQVEHQVSTPQRDLVPQRFRHRSADDREGGPQQCPPIAYQAAWAEDLDPYQPGRRIWLKLKTPATAEAIVGAVTGTLTRPERLILAHHEHRQLVLAGGTAPLTRAQQALVAPLLHPPAGQHPWPPELPSGRTGALGGPRRLLVTLVKPNSSSKSAPPTNTATGHLSRFIRYERFTELRPEDLSSAPR